MLVAYSPRVPARSGSIAATYTNVSLEGVAKEVATKAGLRHWREMYPVMVDRGISGKIIVAWYSRERGFVWGEWR